MRTIRAAIAGGTGLALLILGVSDLSTLALAACAAAVVGVAFVAFAIAGFIEYATAELEDREQ